MDVPGSENAVKFLMASYVALSLHDFPDDRVAPAVQGQANHPGSFFERSGRAHDSLERSDGRNTDMRVSITPPGLF